MTIEWSTASPLEPSDWPTASAVGIRSLGCPPPPRGRSEEHTSELQSQSNLVCRLLLEKKKKTTRTTLCPERQRGESNRPRVRPTSAFMSTPPIQPPYTSLYGTTRQSRGVR